MAAERALGLGVHESLERLVEQSEQRRVVAAARLQPMDVQAPHTTEIGGEPADQLRRLRAGFEIGRIARLELAEQFSDAFVQRVERALIDGAALDVRRRLI